MLYTIKIICKLLKLYKRNESNDSIFLNSFESICNKTFNREKFLIDMCKNKRVLHIGFLDSPFTKERAENKELLHLKIKEVCSYLYGIDIDKKLLEEYRRITQDFDNEILDLQRVDIDLNLNDLNKQFDIILLPEVLEHVPNVGVFVKNLNKLSCLNNSCQLCITVPNAFSIGGFAQAMKGNELVHPSHYYYFSPNTIKKVVNDNGFSNVNLFLYSSDDIINIESGITKSGIIALCKP